MPKLEWERLASSFRNTHIYRCRVPAGWLIYTDGSSEGSITFMPDPKHHWDGGSLEPGDIEIE